MLTNPPYRWNDEGRDNRQSGARMQVIRPVGRDASARKYDILSAMAAHALAGDKYRQRLVLRLMALITARYNWMKDELSVGQQEIARLWSVDERTVKREMAKLRVMGWVNTRRQGARGRVSVLSIDLERIMLDTKAEWANVGPDFVNRIEGAPEKPSTNVVPLRPAPAVTAEGLWGEASARLAEEDRASFDSWFAGLTEAGVADGCLTLIAPTRFHATYVQTHLSDRMHVAVRRCDGAVTRIKVLSV